MLLGAALDSVLLGFSNEYKKLQRGVIRFRVHIRYRFYKSGQADVGLKLTVRL